MKNLLLQLQQVKEVDLKQLKEMSRDLAQTIQESGYIPQHILCVERAGLLIGYEMADYFKCRVSGICTNRKGGSLKSKLKVILRHLPRWLTHLLRSIELKSNVHEVNNERNVSFEFNEIPPYDEKPSHDKRILIVDDAIDTGHSLVSIIDFLKKLGYSQKNLKIAVLTTTRAEPVLKADYSLLNEVTCAFPWSYDSKQFEDTWRVYKGKKSIMSLNLPYELRILFEKIDRLGPSDRKKTYRNLIRQYADNKKSN